MKTALQIIEANLNRLREGVRVVEDALRYSPTTQAGLKQAKELRHRIGKMEDELRKSLNLLAERDVVKDAGAKLTTAAEKARGSVKDVMSANFKRAQEAARSLEEYLKVAGAKRASEAYKAFRFDIYRIETAVEKTLAAAAAEVSARRRPSVKEALAKLPFYMIVDESMFAVQKPAAIIAQGLEAGVKVFQLRVKTWSATKYVKVASSLVKLTREAGALLIVNDRVDVALAAGADGVHVGPDDVPVKLLRMLMPGGIVGGSARTAARARALTRDGADYLGVGSIFPTGTKGDAKVVGLAGLRRVRAATDLPIVAIGGITPANARQALDAGADAVTAISALTAKGAAVPLVLAKFKKALKKS
jgi:thiamine-phosphate pyrophosphorylase